MEIIFHMALGKGLSSLIQPREDLIKNPAGERQMTPTFMPIFKIRPNPLQPRKDFSAEAMEDLAQSIRENGILQPIVVSKLKDPEGAIEYQIVAGERRWRASKMIGLKEIPVVAREVKSDQEGIELGILENIQRENLNPIELAMAYKQLVGLGIAQEEIGKKIGKSRQVIGNTMRLLSLPKLIQDDIKNGILSENHSRAILALPTEDLQLKLWKEIKEQKLSARHAEVAARKYKKTPSQSVANLDALSREMVVQLEAYLGTKVTVEPGKHVSDGGKIIIKYFSNEDLKNIVRKITQAR